jgi:hypothetical protein
LRRYTGQALLALASEDNDAEPLAGVDNKPIPKKQEPSLRLGFKEPVVPQNTGTFMVVDDRLTCIVQAVTDMQTKQKHVKYLNIVFNGRIDGFNFATCFDTALFEAIKGAVGKEVSFLLKYEKGEKFINITDVLSIEGVEYAKGKPGKREEANAVAEGQ